ncbi:hypothetical protein BV22DRAFT_514413 [Leucogyrophana mollusca]|uniref:Uncharacterized protein n=1 Tax=Leucogyrophana mollusca TaxID=85980 RepID=A0ACB8BIG1_9AGAM|nr:hypothetical protein BV22DRAFT_514413 [Leucogyrophana mollusca]
MAIGQANGLQTLGTFSYGCCRYSLCGYMVFQYRIKAQPLCRSCSAQNKATSLTMHTTLQYNAHSLSHSSSFTSITTESKRNRPATPARSGTTEGPHHARLQPQQWLAAARESTELFKKNGSPLPLIWILVEDNQIPANAVPFEHDRSGNPLFIARALIEGELHIGKAGPQLGGSALISYGGRDRPISKYEVLVCASQLRWGISEQPKSHCNYSQGTVVLTQQHSQFSEHLTCHRQQTQTLRVEDISRVIPDKVNNPREEGLKRLARIKTVILVDDSFSMEGTLWAQAREALGGVVDLANKYGSKGIDLFFLHQDGYEPNLKTKREVESIFDHTVPNGEDTPTAFKLEQIINHYLPFLEAKNSTHEPITVIVLTDGVATDHEDLPARIVEAAHRLENHKIGEEMFGIQFVQIGDDAEAADALNELDDGLAERYNIRDIVDATPFNSSQGAFDTEYMLKILLGSINKDLDNGLRAPQPLVPALATSLQGRQTEGLSRLADVKTVILVDDSFSMADGDRWTQARQALAEVADLVSTYGSKGIDLFFLHQTAFHSNVKV